MFAYGFFQKWSKPQQQFLISKFEILTSYLKCHVDDDYKERVGEVEEQPGLNGLDVRSAGEATGYGEVDGGEDHHAGDVHGDDKFVLAVASDPVR